MPFSFLNFNYCFLGFFLLLCSFFIHHSQSAVSAENPYPFAQMRPGDRCVVSGMSLDHDDIVLLVKGRRVPMKKEALEIFLDDGDRFFSKFEPKGALFTEDLNLPERLSMKWFIFGIYVLLGLIFGAVTSHCAVGKGLKPIPWFFTGFFLSVVGYIAVAVKKPEAGGTVPGGLGKVPLTVNPSVCQGCGSENHPSAKSCSNCGGALSPTSTSEVDRVGAAQKTGGLHQ